MQSLKGNRPVMVEKIEFKARIHIASVLNVVLRISISPFHNFPDYKFSSYSSLFQYFLALLFLYFAFGYHVSAFLQQTAKYLFAAWLRLYHMLGCQTA